MGHRISGILIIVAAMAARGQTNAVPAFEVATVKPSLPNTSNTMFQGLRGGPGTADPTSFTAENVTLFNLLQDAYYLRAEYELSGPDWMRETMFNISARVPGNTSKADFNLMLRNLLSERFQLVFHREQREMRGYNLVVDKGGARLGSPVGASTASVSVPGTNDRPPSTPLQFEKDGCPIIPSGSNAVRIGAHGLTTGKFVKVSMSKFADMLSEMVGRPVSDATGLAGQYDFSLCWASDPGRASTPSDDASDPTGGLSVPQAIEKRLGLKLAPSKNEVRVLVIDQALKVPIGN